MKYQNFISCRSFSLCYGSMSANEVFSGNYSEIGQRNLSIYVYQGSVTIASSDGLSFDCGEQNLVDLQSIVGGLVEYRAGSSGTSWICVNENQRKKEFNFELINTPMTRTVTGSSKETCILCLGGTITCNGSFIHERSYARIKDGSQAMIDVAENATAILMTEK